LTQYKRLMRPVRACGLGRHLLISSQAMPLLWSASSSAKKLGCAVHDPARGDGAYRVGWHAPSPLRQCQAAAAQHITAGCDSAEHAAMNSSCPVSTRMLKKSRATEMACCGKPTSLSALAKPKPYNSPRVNAITHGKHGVRPHRLRTNEPARRPAFGGAALALGLERPRAAHALAHLSALGRARAPRHGRRRHRGIPERTAKLPTLQAVRCRTACKARFRPVASPCPDGVEPPGFQRKVSVRYIGLPPSPGLPWRYRKSPARVNESRRKRLLKAVWHGQRAQ
jgi:hypothetical protein